MTGSLQIKGNKYYAVVRIPDETGKLIQKWYSTGFSTDGNNKRKAQQAVRKIIADLESKKISYSPTILFVDWISKWMEQKKNEVRLNTYESYEMYVNLHIEPYFKTLNISLEALEPQHIQDYYNRKFKGDKGKKGLGANSLIKHHVIIHGALQEAMRKNLIPYNPADRITLPKKEKFVGKAYSATQANCLLNVLTDEPLKACVILGLFYGLRRSEVCGLRWRDIDFASGTLMVCNTVVKNKTLIEHEQTKSQASRRTMYLIPETVAYLKRLKAVQAQNHLLCGQDYHEGDHVCVWPDGRPVSPDYVSQTFKNLLRKNGLPPLRFHELRHTAGSLLLEKGLSAKQIQEYLGHEKVSTTLDIYGHLSVAGKKEAAQVMDGMLDIKAI